MGLNAMIRLRRALYLALCLVVSLHVEMSSTFTLSQLSATEDNDFQTLEEVKGGYYYENNDYPDFQACQEGMLPCQDSLWCYTSDQLCDGIVNCPDASDETVCSCVDRLTSDRRCDNTVDCPDFSDELGCYGCSQRQMWCMRGGASICVKDADVCDGKAICDNSRDEMYCWRLSLQHLHHSDNMTMRKEGFLQVKRKGRWMPVCGHIDQDLTQVMDALCDEVIGQDRVGKNKYKLLATGTNSLDGSIRWAHLSTTAGQVHISKRCISQLAVYATCADPKCVNSGPKRLRRDADPDDTPSSRTSDRIRRDHFSNRRIVGGKESQPDVWTFLVGIKRNGVFICGGSIITAEWVLSAGHCFVRFRKMYYEVQAGMLRRGSWSPFEQTTMVSHVVRHEDFEVTHLFHDLVLLKLQTPLQLNRWVRPVCLATEMDLKMGTLCSVAGWGNILEDGDLSDSLQEVQLPTLDTCTRDFMLVTDDQVVCAGFPEGLRDACQGDSGGPMMCNGTEGWVQAGVVSYGRGCARVEQPGVYSRVTHYRPWVEEKIGKMKDPSLLPKEGPHTTCDGMRCHLQVGSCLPRESVCDRVVDCLWAEDEIECSEFYDGLPSVAFLKSDNSHTTTVETTTNSFTSTQESTTTPLSTTDEPLYPDEGSYFGIQTTELTDSTPTTDYQTTIRMSTEAPRNGSTGGEGSPCSQQQLSLSSLPHVHCSKEKFVCEDLKQCLSWKSVCDGVRHCRDGTDEIGCTCRDRLLKFREDLDCDGYFDCFDLTDEACDLCGEDFLCPRSRRCLSQELVCNTVSDCEYGEDELHCIGLLKEAGVLQYDQYGQLAENAKGTLIIKSGPTWDTICVDHLPEDVGNNVCSYLGYSKLAEVLYEEGPRTLRPQPQARMAAPPKHPHSKISHFFERQDEGLKYRRSLRPDRRPRSSEEWRKVNGSDSNAPREELGFLQELKELSQGRRIKRDVCTQAVVTCERQACGKAPLYFFSSETPVWMPGGAPWAGSVYVEGRYRCGSTLFRSSWAITSRTCMGGVRLDSFLVSVVMGSWRSIGEPTRLWGGHEHDRRVVYMRAVPETDILVLRLAHRMPKTPYINHLCLPSKSVKNINDSSWCTVAGMSEQYDRISVGVAFNPAGDCPAGYICPKHDHDDDDLPCMRSWSGMVACQYTHGPNPTWVGMGVWTYQDPDEGCQTATQHPLFTLDILLTIHSIIEGYTPEQLSKCDGVPCVTAVCVMPEDQCDANLKCPDLMDEPLTCPNPLTMCQPDYQTDLCVCPDGRLPCKDGSCIPDEKICDGVPDCPDATDENNCVCCKHLGGNAPEKLCDGLLDCTDQSDEQFCGCQPQTLYFRCYMSNSKCINRSEVCDGRKNCEHGEDERNCVTLAPAIFVDENVLGVPEKPSQGFLVVRLSGIWYTYLSSMWETYLSHLVCLQIGYYKAESTEERSLNLETVGKMSRSVTEGIFNEILFFPGSLRRAGDVSGNNTVVYIICMENDPLNAKMAGDTETTTIEF